MHNQSVQSNSPVLQSSPIVQSIFQPMPFNAAGKMWNIVFRISGLLWLRNELRTNNHCIHQVLMALATLSYSAFIVNHRTFTQILIPQCIGAYPLVRRFKYNNGCSLYFYQVERLTCRVTAWGTRYSFNYLQWQLKLYVSSHCSTVDIY